LIKGYIYVLSNPSFGDEIYKVGFTTRTPEGRIDELSGSTSVPTPFVLEYTEYTCNCKIVERLVHLDLAQYRLNDRREFFKCDLSTIVTSIRNITVKYIGKNDRTELIPTSELRACEVVEPEAIGICNYGRCYKKAVGIAGYGIKYCRVHLDAWQKKQTRKVNRMQ